MRNITFIGTWYSLLSIYQNEFLTIWFIDQTGEVYEYFISSDWNSNSIIDCLGKATYGGSSIKFLEIKSKPHSIIPTLNSS